MWDKTCSGNRQKNILLQFFAAVHWATPGSFTQKVKEKNLAKSPRYKVTNKGKPPRMFSLACNLLKLDAYSNDFKKLFLAKNLCNFNQIRSNQIAASLNVLNHFDL